MAAPDDIESRLTAVEHEMAQLRTETALARTDAAAARPLSAGADHDVSEVRAELRAHTSALNALRQTQLEQGHRLDRLESVVETGFARVDEGFARVDENFARVDEGFAEVQTVLTTVTTGLTQVVTLIEGLDRGQ